MNDVPDIATPWRTQAIMNQFDIATKKSLGQNFLTDTQILAKIVTAADIQEDDNVIEIGPGIGALTEQLARKAGQVVALEIDERLIPVLDHTLAPYKNVTVLQEDVLKVNLKQMVMDNFNNPERPLKLVANLPYYITTAILMQVLQADLKFDNIVVMMQKEVADRLSAAPGTKDYGSLTLAVQYRMQAHLAFTVSRTSFIPSPNVDSAIVSLTPRKPLSVQPTSEGQLFSLFKIGFAMRRKTLWNNLITGFGKSDTMKEKLRLALTNAQIDPKIRAERLTLEDFITLQNALAQAGVYNA